MSEGTFALCSWSGGKDSCLALHLALDAGLKVTRLVTMFAPDADRRRSHALSEHLFRAQAESLARDLVLPKAGWETYESVFVEELERARLDGIGRAIFGDIDLVPHRKLEEKVCAHAGLSAYLPLWEWPRGKVLDALFERGMEAVCVCVNTRFMPSEFCGRPYDRTFLRDLPQGVDACGENGEFHTFVTNAPRFRTPIKTRLKDRWQYRGPDQYGGDVFWFAELGLERV